TISRKQIVAMPLIMIASCGLSPMSSGNTNVAPNIATTCWAPRPTVLGHDRRSSGATTSFGPRVPSCSFQPIDIVLLQFLLQRSCSSGPAPAVLLQRSCSRVPLNDTHRRQLPRPREFCCIREVVDNRCGEDQDPPVTPLAPLREVPGAGSPLNRAVLTGP